MPALKIKTITPAKEKLAKPSELHVPPEWLELYEAVEFIQAKKDPNHIAHSNNAGRVRGVFASVFKQGSSPRVARSSWGARAPKGGYAKIDAKTGGTAFHWEGPRMGTFTHSACASKVRGIQAYHMDHNGWTDVAYSAIVCPHGYIFECRWLWNRTAANGTNDGNNRFYAICYLGGETDPFTEDAKGAYLDGKTFFQANGGAGNQIKPHSFFKATSCPGPVIRDWITAGCPAPSGYFDEPTPTPAPAPSSSLANQVANAIHFMEDPSSDGGWMVDDQGGVYTLSPSGFYGSLGGVTLNAPITGGVATPTGKGYWLFGADGGVFAFGDAPFWGTHAPLGDEYRAGQRKIIGGFSRIGNIGDPSTWGYVLVSNRLEGYSFG